MESTSKPGDCGEVMHKFPIHDKYVCVDGFVVDTGNGEDANSYHGDEVEQILFLPFISEEDANVRDLKVHYKQDDP